MKGLFAFSFVLGGAVFAAGQTVTYGKGTPTTVFAPRKIEAAFNKLLSGLIVAQSAPAMGTHWKKEEHLHLYKNYGHLEWSVFLPHGIRADYNALTGDFVRYICNAANPKATSHRTNHVAIPGTIDWRSRMKTVGNHTGLAVNKPVELLKKKDRLFVVGLWSNELMVVFDRKSGYVYRLWYAPPMMFGGTSREGTLQKPVY